MSFYRQIGWFLIFVGVAGTILFFPFNMHQKYTCLYHRLFQANRALRHNSASENQLVDRPARSVENAEHEHSKEVIESYIHHFAFFWWGSFLLVLGGLYLMKLKRNTTNDSGSTFSSVEN